MARAKKKQLKKIKIIFFTLGCLTILLLLLFIYREYAVIQQLNRPLTCSDPATFRKYIELTWQDKKTLLDGTNDASHFSPEQPVALLLDNSTPHLGMPGRLAAGIDLNADQDKVTKFYDSNILPKILASGYKLDALSTGEGENKHADIFIKGDEILSVAIGTDYSGNQSIVVACAKKDPKRISLYRELLKTNMVKQNIESGLQYDLKATDTGLDVWGNYGNIIALDMGNWSGGGSGIWFAKNLQGKWVGIYAAQIPPPCALLKSYNAPKGVPCTDSNNPNNLNAVTE